MTFQPPKMARVDPSADRIKGRKIEAYLQFSRTGKRTYLRGQHTPHPFHITRPFYLPGDPDGLATLYLQSSSGGLYGDDNLTLSIEAQSDTQTHVTTQASSVVHAARGGCTHQKVSIKVAEGGYIEYFPEPMILFPEAVLDSKLSVTLSERAKAVFSDSYIVHDPASSGTVFDRLNNCITISTSSKEQIAPQLIDSMATTGEIWRSMELCCISTIHLSGCDHPEAAREAMQQVADNVSATAPGFYVGVDALVDRSIVSLRMISADGATHTAAMRVLTAAARMALIGAPIAEHPK